MSENIPDDLRYTRSHEWLRTEGETLTVGITDHAQDQLGDLVFVELPEADRSLTQGEACAVVESVKAASDVYAPVAGAVIAANEALADTPELVNSDPYGQGWLFKLRPGDGVEEQDLMNAEAYRAFVASESS